MEKPEQMHVNMKSVYEDWAGNAYSRSVSHVYGVIPPTELLSILFKKLQKSEKIINITLTPNKERQHGIVRNVHQRRTA